MQLAEEVGFSPPRLVRGAAINVFNKEMQDILGLFFYSCTVAILLLGYQCWCNLVQYLFSFFPFWNKRRLQIPLSHLPPVQSSPGLW